MARCGLFHSAYSNSYVNLAIFKAGEDRDVVRNDCGSEAEDLIYKFCGESDADLCLVCLAALSPHICPLIIFACAHIIRHTYTLSSLSSVIPRQQIIVDTLFPMDRVPSEGLTVKHIHTGNDVNIHRSSIYFS